MRNAFSYKRIRKNGVARLATAYLTLMVLVSASPLNVSANDALCAVTPGTVGPVATLGDGFDNVPLQQVLDNNGYSINASNDQTNYKFWNVTDTENIELSVKLIGTISAFDHTFGYYTNGDTSNFTGLFEVVGDQSHYSLPIKASGETVSVSIPASGITSIAFGIDAETPSGETYGKFFTDPAHNSDDAPHATVYNKSTGTYVVGFEDLKDDQPWDFDYQDVVVEVSLDCTTPDEELATGYARINATLDGAPWVGSIVVDFDAPDPGVDGTSSVAVPLDYPNNVFVGQYSFEFNSGGPANADFSSITVLNSASDCGAGCGVLAETNTIANPLTFTFNFVSDDEPEQCLITITSDTTNQVTGGGNAVATYDDNPSWTANIPGATWIWKTFLVPNPLVDETNTFTRSFNLVKNASSTVVSANLTIAADNSYNGIVNGTQVVNEQTATNYFDANKKVIDVKNNLVNGVNSLSFTVKNWGQPNVTPQTNPGGLIYKLDITATGENCDDDGGLESAYGRINATLDGVPWAGSIVVNFDAPDPGVDGTATVAVPIDYLNNVFVGSYAFTFVSGGPANSQFSNITVSNGASCGTGCGTLTVANGPSNPLTFTFNFTSNGGGGGGNGADLSVSKTSNKTAPSVTETIVYTITVTNNGPETATAVTVNDTLPNTLSFLSASSSVGTYSATTSVWTIGNLSSGASATLTISAQVNPATEGQNISNTATVTSTKSDPNSGNNTSTVTVTVNNPGCITNCGGGGGGGGGGNAICSNSRDDDGDGLIDSADPGCHSDGNAGNPNSYVPSDNSEQDGEVLGTSTGTCFYLRDYLRIDFNNDPAEVLKLQAFLRVFEGHTNVSLNGVFDQATYDAVSEFQVKYFNDILEPWGHTGPTGYVYYLTQKKINEIYCQRTFPLTQFQKDEIVAFKALLQSLGVPQNSVGGGESTPAVPTPGQVGGTSSTTPVLPPIVGEIEPSQGQNLRNLAAAVFAQPETLLDATKCLYKILLLLVVLYILGNIVKDVLYKNVPENTRKRFLAKWITIDLGLVIALVVAYILEWWCLILPLLIALIIALLWTLTYPEHNSLKASVKSWYLVGSARAKSMAKSKEPIKTDPSGDVIIIESKK